MSEVNRKWLAPIPLALGTISLSAAVSAAHLSGEGGEYFDKARVTDVKPIVRIVQVSTPREVCWNEQIRQDSRGYDRRHRSYVPTVLGGIIGGVVGNQFGKGHGNDAMTVAGVLLGASVGRDSSYRQQGNPGPRYVSARRCEIEETVHEEERIEGYRVTYHYQGRDYVTHMNRDPGRSIRVSVRVDPAD